MKNNKILMLLDNSYTGDYRVENEINALRNKGFFIHLICVEHSDFPKVEEAENLKIERCISKQIHSPLSKLWIKNEKKIIKKIIKTGIKNIHCHDYRTLPIGGKLKKSDKSFRIIFDSHEYLPGYPYYKRTSNFSNRIKGKIVWNYYLYRHNKYLKYADDIISVSQSICNKFKDLTSKKAILIRNIPPNSNKAQKGERYFNQKFNIPMDSKIIIHTGNTHFNIKRFSVLCDITKNHSTNIHVVFIGSLNSINVLKPYVKKNNLKHIHFHKGVPRDELTFYCSQADIGLVYFWNPVWESYNLAIPNKLMDTTLAGLPILATDQLELNLFNQKHRHMAMFNGDKINSLSESIDYIINNYDKLKKNALKVSEEISWEKESEKLIKLYTN